MPQFTPYAHQKECLSVLQIVRKRGKNKALVVMASGLGKTVVAAFDVHNYLSRRGGRVLSLCHQNDISDQSYETFEEVLGEGYSFGYLDGREKEFEPVDVLFASFQTMHNWREEFPPDTFDYIIVDESHHSPAETYLPTLEYFKPRFLLGITATPDRTDLQDIREIYGDEVYSLPLEEGLAQGLLAQVDYRMVTDELQNLKILDTPIGKLSIAKLNRELFIPKRDDEIARIIQEKIAEIESPRVMIFAQSIAYCDRLARILPDASPIHSEMPLNKQAETLRKFRAREVNTIITVDKFNEGIDVPDANVIVFLRSTNSRTIFFQQLGRGLRKTVGKRQVLVLDFVANCERLEMVHGLWSEVEEKKGKIKNGPPKIKEPLVVDMGQFEFDEKARKLSDVVERIRTGYTKQVMLKQLTALASQLERVPKQKDVALASKQGKCPAVSTYQRHFGTYFNALRLAGFERSTSHYRIPNEEFLEALTLLAEKLGHTPTTREVDKAHKFGETPYSTIYKKRFGSYNEALRQAGLPITHRLKTLEEHLSDLRALAKDLGRAPTAHDVEKAARQGKCAYSSTYQRRFGSLTEAIRQAGFPKKIAVAKKIPAEARESRGKKEGELLADLKLIAEELGRALTKKDVDQAAREGKCYTYNGYRYRFGTLNNALKKAGLTSLDSKTTKHVRKQPVKKSDDELLEDLVALSKILGRTPTQKELSEASKVGWCASLATYKRRFGSYTNACKEAGLKPNKSGGSWRKKKGN